MTPASARRQPRRDRGAHLPRLPGSRHRDRRGLLRRRPGGAARRDGRPRRAARAGAGARELSLDPGAARRGAKKTGARLVHPGYGFLAENAAFARACRDAGLTFVGPTPEAIAAMGSKTGSRAAHGEGGVPVVPGMGGAGRRPRGASRRLPGRPAIPSCSRPRRAAAARGCGGWTPRPTCRRPSRASRPRRKPRSATARSTPRSSSSGRGTSRSRSSATCTGTWSRWASASAASSGATRRSSRSARRPPSSGPVRERLFEAALAAARAVGYTSCGTVEFLLAADGAIYFLEMNTRLQVEHPVTEEVWGVDLAATMIRIALGEKLPFDAASLAPRGHAIECRIYAEDPRRGFAPSPGLISGAAAAAGPRRAQRRGRGGGLGRADRLRPDARQADRARARPRRRRSPGSPARSRTTRSAGVETTLPLFRALARDPEFVRGDFDVQWLDRRLAAGLFPADRAGSGRGVAGGGRARGRRGARHARRIGAGGVALARRGAGAKRSGADGCATSS